MFVNGVRGVRGMGEFQQRSPDFKLDNWIGQPIGGGMQSTMVPASSVVLGVSNTTAAVVGIGGLAAAALAWYLLK